MNPLRSKIGNARFVFRALAILALTPSAHAAGVTGTYTGTYGSFNNSGDSGTVTITVDTYGSVNCDFYSAVQKKHFMASGSANSFPGPVVTSTTGGVTTDASTTWTNINCVSGPRINPGGPVNLPPPPPASSSVYLAAQISLQWAGALGIIATTAGTWINANGDTGPFSINTSPSVDASMPINPAILSGLWYDPKYTGSGFNFTGSGMGLLVTYFGWDKSGNRLWLNSTGGPTQITMGQSFSFNLVQTQGGNFIAPAAPKTATPWGTLTLTFTSCTAATAKLSGADGDVSESLSLLVGLNGLNCQ